MKEKIQKVLPTKKFAIVIGSIAGGLLIILIVTSYFGTKQTFQNTKTNLAPSATIGDVVSRDSNANGIPDWEEVLWRLDPKANGAENKKIIDEKRSVANVDAGARQPQESLTETARFSHELLATVSALRANGSLTPDAIDALSSSLDIDIASHRNETPTYTEDNLFILSSQKDTPEAYKAYRAQFKRIALRYQNSGLGTELDIIGQGIDDGTQTGTLSGLTPIANAYIKFGKEIMALKTPADAVPTVLELANASDHIGVALLKTEQLYTDAMTGVVGLDEYINDIDLFNGASQDVISYFASKDLEQ